MGRFYGPRGDVYRVGQKGTISTVCSGGGMAARHLFIVVADVADALITLTAV